MRISRISGEVHLPSFLFKIITGDSPRFCLEDKLSKYLEGLVESVLGKYFNRLFSILGILDEDEHSEVSLVGLVDVDLSPLTK